MTQRILITGGSGFIGGHCVQAALDAGYDVRTTARSTAHADALKARFSAPERVEVVAADLGSDTGWREAMDGVDGVLHVASPLPHGEPKDPDEVIRPAVDGTLRVLRAATDAAVRRVVFTSSFGAIGFGHSRHTLATHLFTEDDWAPLESRTLNTYDRSKTLAERAAWEYVQTTPGAPELVVLNPVAVIGSLRGSTPSGGNGVIAMMLQGKLPMLVETWFPIVDVRDVAQAELRALEVPEAAGHRFLISSGEGMTLPQIAGLLRDELGDRASQVQIGRAHV